ncbi:unnamed protein product [Nezara viridula]|uniref:Uncharacterized protein n=1 Tax=Nezara viridula TaxID=85310 RepID=A0A9P0HI55_NEZVI|nr:unnamed protein product [Nezara viridula]
MARSGTLGSPPRSDPASLHQLFMTPTGHHPGQLMDNRGDGQFVIVEVRSAKTADALHAKPRYKGVSCADAGTMVPINSSTVWN